MVSRESSFLPSRTPAHSYNSLGHTFPGTTRHIEVVNTTEPIAARTAPEPLFWRSHPWTQQLGQQNMPLGNKATRVATQTPSLKEVDVCWGETGVSVLFRVRLALGSYLRKGGEPNLFNLIIVPRRD